jgi:hypothetical protein
MTLNPYSKALLDICAQAIVRNSRSDVDLFPLNSDHSVYSKETPEYLAGKVEELTHRTRTVRRADPALFANIPQGRYFFLVACPYDTPQGRVTELTEDMVLVGLGLSSNGFQLPAKQATPETTAKYRRDAETAAARAETSRRLSEKADEIEAAFMTALTDTARRWISDIVRHDAELRDYERILNRVGGVTLKDIALVCVKLELPLSDMIAETLERLPQEA